MSLFRRREAPQVEERQRVTVTGAGVWFWSGSEALAEAVQSEASWAARRVLCKTVAKLPVDQIRTSGDRRAEMTQAQVVRRPSGRVSRRTWLYQVMDSLTDAGNVYGDIVATDSFGRPTQVEILAPSLVSWSQHNGELLPHVQGKPRRTWPLGDLWHVPLTPRAGSPVGEAPSEVGALSDRTTAAAQRFASDFFDSSGHPVYDITARTALNDEQAEAIKHGFIRSVRARRPWVHGDAIEAKAMAVDMKTTQFVELMRFGCEQAARVYGVPPTMIYAAISGSSVTYANVTDDDLTFLKYTLDEYLDLLEEEWSAWLPTPHVVKFNRDAVLAMTPEKRAAVNEIRLRSKTITVNEVRDKEDMPRFADPIYNQPGIPELTQMALPLGGGA